MLLTLSSGNKKLGPWSVNTVLLGGSKQTENAVNATNAIKWKQETQTVRVYPPNRVLQSIPHFTELSSLIRDVGTSTYYKRVALIRDVGTYYITVSTRYELLVLISTTITYCIISP